MTFLPSSPTLNLYNGQTRWLDIGGKFLGFLLQSCSSSKTLKKLDCFIKLDGKVSWGNQQSSLSMMNFIIFFSANNLPSQGP